MDELHQKDGSWGHRNSSNHQTLRAESFFSLLKNDNVELAKLFRNLCRIVCFGQISCSLLGVAKDLRASGSVSLPQALGTLLEHIYWNATYFSQQTRPSFLSWQYSFFLYVASYLSCYLVPGSDRFRLCVCRVWILSHCAALCCCCLQKVKAQGLHMSHKI